METEEKDSHLVWLSFGSNCGEREALISKAIKIIGESLKEVSFSDIYETPEIHGKGAPYLNAVMKGHTFKSFEIFNQELKEYEISEGRDSECRLRGLVPIDIDIVIWDSKVIRPKDFSASFFQLGYQNLF